LLQQAFLLHAQLCGPPAADPASEPMCADRGVAALRNTWKLYAHLQLKLALLPGACAATPCGPFAVAAASNLSRLLDTCRRGLRACRDTWCRRLSTALPHLAAQPGPALPAALAACYELTRGYLLADPARETPPSAVMGLRAVVRALCEAELQQLFENAGAAGPLGDRLRRATARATARLLQARSAAAQSRLPLLSDPHPHFARAAGHPPFARMLALAALAREVASSLEGVAGAARGLDAASCTHAYAQTPEEVCMTARQK
jgi:hypothetical protein